MKIAILTLPVNYNYGGIMQAYALQIVLKKSGHSVEVLDVPRRLYDEVGGMTRIKRFVKKHILRKKISRLPFEQKYYEDCLVNRYTWQFIDSHIHTRTIHRFSELLPDDYDAIVVGSDQVWRPMYFKNDFQTGMPSAYLDFAQTWRIKRVAYSASLGTDCWEYTADETSKCRPLAQMFDAISVRESSSIGLLKEKLGVEPILTLDPTLLLDENEYVTNLGLNYAKKSKGNLHCYILDESELSESIVRKLCSMNSSFSPFSTNGNAENGNVPVEERTQLPVETWLRGFVDADMIVTDSFHACVFSIIFKKPFVVICNSQRGVARIQSLLQMFGLQNRLVSHVDDVDEALLTCDYTHVEELLNQSKEKSMLFLIDSLS